MAVTDKERENEKDRERRKKNKLGYMIISVIISIIIWGMVAYMTDPDVSKTIHDVNVRLVGEEALKEKGLIVTGTEDIPDLAVKISGKRSDMAYAIDNVVVELDVSEIDGTGEYELEGSVVLPNSRISLERIKFDSVPVTVDEYKEKEINIEIRQTGIIRGKLVRSESDTKTVTISGAGEEIDSVACGYATVDVSKLDGDREIRTNFVMADNNGDLITKNETLRTETPDIVIMNTVYDATELPVEAELIGDAVSGYILNKEETRIDPQRVTVGVLPGNSFSAVKAEVTGTQSGEYSLKEEEGMYIPENIKKVNVEPSVYSSTGFSAEVGVEIMDIGEGLHVEGAPSVTAYFHGSESEAGNIRAYAYASGLAEGSHTLPVTFECGSLHIEGEYNVEIVISR